MTLVLQRGNLDYVQEKKIPETSKIRRNSGNPKNLKFSFRNLEKIDLIILPNRSDRSNRKKTLNRLDRFIGQRINTCMHPYSKSPLYASELRLTKNRHLDPSPVTLVILRNQDGRARTILRSARGSRATKMI